jgi:hypothetical protein
MSKNTIFRKKNIQSVLSQSEDGHSSGLVKVLGVRDLTSFGIAAIIGAGIFSTIGRASFEGGKRYRFFLFLFRSPAYLQRFVMHNLRLWCQYRVALILMLMCLSEKYLLGLLVGL